MWKFRIPYEEEVVLFYGVDIGEEQINYLTSYGLKLVKADIFKYLEDDTRKYDLITLFDVLEHSTR